MKLGRQADTCILLFSSYLLQFQIINNRSMSFFFAGKSESSDPVENRTRFKGWTNTLHL